MKESLGEKKWLVMEKLNGGIETLGTTHIVKEFWIGVNCMDMLLKQMPLGIVILMGNSLKLHALQMGMSMPIA